MNKIVHSILAVFGSNSWTKYCLLTKKIVYIVNILCLARYTYGQAIHDSISFSSFQFVNNSKQEVQTELGKFNVKENRNNPNSRTISISFVRFKSTNTNPGPPIIYLAGGPGGSGIAAARGPRFELFMALRAFGDVIALDQRGTGLSNSLPAPPEMEIIPLDMPGTKENYLPILKRNLEKSIVYWKSIGIDPEGYNIIQNADDIEDLRKYLKTNKIILWGISFGSQLAFVYSSRYPENVSDMILAGLEAPYENVKYPHQTNALLRKIDLKLKSNAVDSLKYPDLPGLMKRVFQRLEKQPAAVQMKMKDGEKTVKIGKLDVQVVTAFILLKNIRELVQLPALFKQMDEGNYMDIAKYVIGIKGFARNFAGMGALTDVMTGIDEKRWENIKEESNEAVMEHSLNFPYPEIINGLGLPDIGNNNRSIKKNSVPCLLLSGDLDGRTYIESAKEIKSYFPNGKHVIIENVGHDLFEASPEIQKLIVQYLSKQSISNSITLSPVVFQ